MSAFDYESWDYSWEGKSFKVNGKKVMIDAQLTEHEDVRMAQRHVFALGRMKPNDEVDREVPIMIKLRYDLDPEPFDIEDIEENAEDTYEHVLFELELIRLLAGIGHGPRLLANSYVQQNKHQPYPGGYLHFLVMERVPGEDVDEIQDDLSARQLRSIKKQLAYILETMRANDRCMDTEDPSCLRYDAKKDKLYLVDLTHWGAIHKDDTDVITEDSPFVLSFGLWDNEDQQPQVMTMPLQSLQ